MTIVDTHTHTSPYWFEPVEILRYQMSANSVDRAILVQHRGNYDNRYIIECMRRYPGRFVACVIVDTALPNVLETLEYWAHEGATGVRLSPAIRSPGNDPLAIWRKVGALGMVVEAHGSEEEYASDDFQELVECFPETTFVMEHLGGVRREDTRPYATFRKVLSLARYPNVFMKVGGLGEICPRPSPFNGLHFKDVPPLIKWAAEAFRPNHLMFGSDYPPVSRREGYTNALRLLREYLDSFLDEEESAWVLGKTALKVWQFPQEPILP